MNGVLVKEILPAIHVGTFCSMQRESRERRNIIAIHSTPDLWEGNMWMWKEDAVKLRDALNEILALEIDWEPKT